MIEDTPLYRSLYDGHDLYELIDLLVEAGIIDKENLLEKYWYEVVEAEEEITPFS